MKRFIGSEIRTLTNLLKREVHQEGQDIGMCSTSLHGLVIQYLLTSEHKDIFQKDIEEEFSMRRSTASRMLKLMECKGMIERVSVQEDARLKKLLLTEKAKASHQSLDALHNKVEQKMITGISEKELNTFFEVIDKIKENLEE